MFLWDPNSPCSVRSTVQSEILMGVKFKDLLKICYRWILYWGMLTATTNPPILIPINISSCTVCVCVFILILLFLGEWTSPTVTGDRPPPIDAFTLTSITNTTSLLFGGYTGGRSSNNVYIFEFTDTSVVSVLLV